MKAIVYRRYGGPEVLRTEELPKPEPAAGRVLIEVVAASVNRSDWEALTARPVYVRMSGAGMFRPKQHILGSDFAGRIVGVGDNVEGWQAGEAVFGDLLYHGAACFAQFVSVRADAPITRKPAGLSYDDAATLPQAAGLALQGLRHKRPLEAGEHVAVNGAGGGAGSFAVQVAKSLGAEVTAVDHTVKLDAMRDLGADHVVDYTREKVTRLGPYDRILDFAAAHSMNAYRRALRTNGVYSVVGGSLPKILKATTIGPLVSRRSSKQMGLLMARASTEDLDEAARMVADGVVEPLIGGRYRLEQVPDALAHLGTGKAIGKLVIGIA